MGLNGRVPIYTSVEDLDAKTVLSEVNGALAIHFNNVKDEKYLYNYRRGIQPILHRTKERNGEICCNKVVENHAEQVVAFKNGYFLTQKLSYVARNEESAEKVKTLNEYLYRSGKHSADNDVVDWFHTVGLAYVFVEPTDDNEKPYVAYSLEPMTACVVKSLGAGNKPVYGMHVVSQGENIYVDVYTRSRYFRLWGTVDPIHPKDKPDEFVYVTKVLEERPNMLAPYVPIIEYKYNKTLMSSFEPSIALFDAINDIDSNALDGVAQFIQSLLVATNVEFDEDVTAGSIRNSGMVCLKSVGDNKADIKILAEQLDQTQTEVLKHSILKQAFDIVGVPMSQEGGSSDNVGASIFKYGYETAESYARNTEDEFRKSNELFDEIVLKILRDKNLLDLNTSDFDIAFIRNELANIQAKAQACGTMVGFGLHPILAMEWSGLTNDPLSAYEMSKEYFDKKQNYTVESGENYGVQSGTQYGTNQEPTETEVVEDEITI